MQEETSVLYSKSFTIVIYDCNDYSGRKYYKTIIAIVRYAPNLALALACVINYDRKWYHILERHLLTKLEASFMILMCL